jgi:hypothetical protein
MVICLHGATWGIGVPKAGAHLVHLVVILSQAPDDEVPNLLKPLCCNLEHQTDLLLTRM